MGNNFSIPCLKCPFAAIPVDQDVRDMLKPRRELPDLVEQRGTLRGMKENVEVIIRGYKDQNRKWEGGEWWVLQEGVRDWVAAVNILDVEITGLLDPPTDRPSTCCCLCSNYSLAEQIRIRKNAVTVRIEEHNIRGWGDQIWRRDVNEPTAEQTNREVELLVDLRIRLEMSANDSMPGKVRSNSYCTWLASVASVEKDWNMVRDNPGPECVTTVLAEAMQLRTQGEELQKNRHHLVIDAREMLTVEYRKLDHLKQELDTMIGNLLLHDPRKEKSLLARNWLERFARVKIEFENIGDDDDDDTIHTLRATIKELHELGSQYLSSHLLVQMRPVATSRNIPRSQDKHCVGMEKNRSQILGYLNDDQVDCIGIYGMGGVGKTTLVNKIEERLRLSTAVKFDLVISLVVSNQPDIFKIQEDIGLHFGFSRKADNQGIALPSSKNDRAAELSVRLSEKTFLLILDDIWKEIDLAEIGIPSGSNHKSKILLTTRERYVCSDMKCQRVLQIRRLSDDDSWELFRHGILDASESAELSQDILSIAQDVLKKCGGLPLAINIIAAAMRGKNQLVQWEVIKSQLHQNLPTDLPPNVDTEVYNVLKFSLDNLREEIQQCFLFCALFQEDENIAIAWLVNYWIGEGLLDHTGLSDVVQLRLRGRGIIEDLKAACLLESGDKDDSVKMHDVVRDMAIWLGKGGASYNKCKFFTKILSEQQQVTVDREWWDARRILLSYNGHKANVEFIEEEMRPSRSNIPLRTFIFSAYRYKPHSINFPESFFRLAKELRVFDVRHAQMHSFPECLLQLLSLRYLDLSETNLTCIPVAFGNLTNLLVLHLADNSELTSIPSAAISPLTKLQILNLERTPCFQRKEESDLRIEDLKNLRGLKTISLLLVKHMEDVQQVLRSDVVPANCIRSLEIREVDELTTDLVHTIPSKHSEKMKSLSLMGCQRVEGTFKIDNCCQSVTFLSLIELPLKTITTSTQCESLSQIDVQHLPQLVNFPSLLNFPNLEWLDIWSCKNLVELGPVEEEEKDDDDEIEEPSISSDQKEIFSLPKLQYIYLIFLPELSSISNVLLHLPSLLCIRVMGCPRLRKLPVILDKNVQIDCDREWWENLVWENQTTKERFNPTFFTTAESRQLK